jgi:hypothetical protein
LRLGRNKLTSLPGAIGNLVYLERLIIHSNRLTNLPASFSNLTSLEDLSLSDNHLTELPEDFGNLTNLKELRIFSNRLTHLPESFGNLVNLEVLFLGSNKLTHLPDSFYSLPNLRRLDLSDNPNLVVDMNRMRQMPGYSPEDFTIPQPPIIPVNLPESMTAAQIQALPALEIQDSAEEEEKEIDPLSYDPIQNGDVIALIRGRSGQVFPNGAKYIFYYANGEKAYSKDYFSEPNRTNPINTQQIVSADSIVLMRAQVVAPVLMRGGRRNRRITKRTKLTRKHRSVSRKTRKARKTRKYKQ